MIKIHSYDFGNFYFKKGFQDLRGVLSERRRHGACHATAFGRSQSSSLTTYAYQVFLILNVIVFPAFLLIQEYYLLGLAVFFLELLFLLFISPRVNRDSHTEFFQKLYGARENEIARVELQKDGILYSSKGGYSFFPWHRIGSIEETDTTIFYYFDGNGFGVPKSGFAYKEDQASFLEFSKSRLKVSRQEQLSE